MKKRIGSIAGVAVGIVVGAGLAGLGGAVGDAQARAQAPPVNGSPPTISGVAQVGARLTAERGDWSNGATSYAFQWQRCNASGTPASCVNIAGETSNVRDLTAGDQGNTVRVRVIASNADGASAPAFSAASAVVQAAVAPAITQLPAITGTARVGQTLTTDRGQWANNPTSFAYQWSRCNANGDACVDIPGENAQNRILTPGDQGSRLRVRVTASNAGGSSSAISSASDVVQAAGAAPANTAAPTISGTPQAGQTLTAANGTWSNSPTSFTYQWQRCNSAGASCTNIPGETGQTRIIANDDVGNRLRVVVTARNAVGSSSANSNPSEVIATGLPAGAIRLPSGRVSIPVTSVSLPERLIVETVRFNPNPVRSRAPITVQFRVSDTRGYVVRDALVFVRSTPLVTSTPPETATRQDGWVILQVTPRSTFPLNGKAVQFFVRARKQGENALAGVSTRRLVQVRTVRP